MTSPHRAVRPGLDGRGRREALPLLDQAETPGGAPARKEGAVDITDARVKLVSDKADKLKAFCTITIDRQFVIRDIKVIKGTRGYFVAMPSRKLMDRCPTCGGKNHLRAAYCNDCGGALRGDRVPHDAEGRAKLHADIAHPINSACREKLQRRIIEAYEAELEQSRQPGYAPLPDSDDLEESPGDSGPLAPAAPEGAGPAAETEIARDTDTEKPPDVPAELPRPADESAPPPDQPTEAPSGDSFSSGIL